MNFLARTLVVAYTLAILLAGLGPHCAWMFSSAQAATVQATNGDDHADHTGPSETPDRDCAAMEMAKSLGPVTAVFAIATPDFTVASAVLPEQRLFNAPEIVDAVQPRGPPRTSGGFAAIFASNHRLLI